MKKYILPFVMSVLLLLGACSGNAEQNYVYGNGQLNAYISQDGRQLIFEDMPENDMEAAVADRYYFEFARDYDAWGKLDKRLDTGTLENTEKAYQEGYYIQKKTVKSLETCQPEDLEMEKYIPDYLEIVEQNSLKEYTLVMVTVDQEWSNLDRSPQIGNGEYSQLFLLGKTDGQYQIYESSMP